MTAPAHDRAPDEAMRKAFEAWFAAMGPIPRGAIDHTKLRLWHAWQESARSQSAALAEKERRIEHLLLRINELDAGWDKAESSLAMRNAEFAELYEQRSETAESSLADARAEVERLRGQLLVAQAEAHAYGDAANQAEAELSALRAERAERNKTDPITRLHNLADAMEESRNDSPYTQEAWNAQDDAYREKCGEVASLRAALAAKDAEVAELTKWTHDLQSGMYINCVYCGHRYGPRDNFPSTMAAILKLHIEQCPQHPMSALKSALAAKERECAEARKDAERYRWLRTFDGAHRVFVIEPDSMYGDTMFFDAELDEKIDAAIAQRAEDNA